MDENGIWKLETQFHTFLICVHKEHWTENLTKVPGLGSAKESPCCSPAKILVQQLLKPQITGSTRSLQQSANAKNPADSGFKNFRSGIAILRQKFEWDIKVRYELFITIHVWGGKNDIIIYIYAYIYIPQPFTNHSPAGILDQESDPPWCCHLLRAHPGPAAFGPTHTCRSCCQRIGIEKQLLKCTSTLW